MAFLAPATITGCVAFPAVAVAVAFAAIAVTFLAVAILPPAFLPATVFPAAFFPVKVTISWFLATNVPFLAPSTIAVSFVGGATMTGCVAFPAIAGAVALLAVSVAFA